MNCENIGTSHYPLMCVFYEVQKLAPPMFLDRDRDMQRYKKDTITWKNIHTSR